MDVATKPVDLEQAVFAAFEPFLNQTTTLRGALLAAFDFAPIARADASEASAASGTGQIIVIDKASLLLGMVAAGRDCPPSSSARSLYDWLQKEGADLSQLGSTGNASLNQRALVAGNPVIASRSLRGRVLPEACRLAQQTVGRDIADARHVIFALLEEPPSSFGAIGNSFAGPKLARLKKHIVDRIAAGPEEHENIDAWRKLVDAPPPSEAVATLSDAPALIDALGRQAFAEVLATRIKQVSKSLRSGKLGDDSAFIMHIDGPWGSGKTSVLNLLKADLGRSDPPWLIVEFNAWRNQQRTPAWWPIISHVGAAVSRLSWWEFPKARWCWAWWNLRMRWVPIVFSLLLTGVFAFFAWRAVSGHQPKDMLDTVKDMVAGALALVSLAGLAWTASRSIFFGSKNAAEAYVQSTSEPFRPIVKLFERMIWAMKRPVAVFIDDLDRCDSSYVIDLLEGIQTLLRSAPVVYVVAGDRKWICSSFEKRYVDFCGQIGMPGRPLGYLFLDKVFQLSTGIPRLSTLHQAAYWKRLLETGEAGARSTPGEIRRLEAEAEDELKGKTSHEEIQRQIDRTEEGSIERETIRAAAAKQITSPEAIQAAEHRLQPMAALLEPNPRAMKRLVNAYGLNHARAFLEGRTVTVEALARWTIVELRWPLLADYLATNWTDVASGNLAPNEFPDLIRTLLADSDVAQVFGSEGDIGQLTRESLTPILE